MLIYFVTVIIILIAVKYFLLTAPFLPTKRQDLATVSAVLEKYQIKSLMDLGCGIGGVLAYLNKNDKSLRLSGLEISLGQFMIAKLRFLFNKKVKVRWRNLFWVNWDKSQAVYMFWRPQTIEKYRKKIEDQLNSGQFVISYCFEIPWLKPMLLERVKQDELMPVYIYKV